MNEMRDSGISTKMVSVPKGDPRGEIANRSKGERGGGLGISLVELVDFMSFKMSSFKLGEGL